MRRALRLAVRGLGQVSPRPLTGAVLVRDGRIVGEGACLINGGESAEVGALRQAGNRARGADLFINIEPGTGKDPGDQSPGQMSAEVLAAAGVCRVFCAVSDPDPWNRGRWAGRLRRTGVEVEVGMLAAEAAGLNAAYIKHRRSGLPWTVLKLAQSLDGRIATRDGDARWITGPRARAYGHRWRSRLDAVLVGANTVLADDPRLDVRLVRGRNPVPVVLDGRLRVTPGQRLFTRPGTVLITSDAHADRRLRPFVERGARVWRFPARQGRLDLSQVFRRLGREGFGSLLVEGGGQVAAAVLKARLVDRMLVFVAPRLLGEGVAAVGDLDILRVKDSIGLGDGKIRRLGPDLLYTAEVKYPCSLD